MKSKKFYAGMLAVLGILVLSSFAASRVGDFRQLMQRNPETRANVVTMVMKNRLELTDEQVEKAYAINLKYAKLNQPLFESEKEFEPTPEFAAQNKERRDELKALLTDEQLKKADELRQKMIGRLELVLAQLKENN